RAGTAGAAAGRAATGRTGGGAAGGGAAAGRVAAGGAGGAAGRGAAVGRVGADGRAGRALAAGPGAPPASAGRLAPQRQVKMKGGTRRPHSHIQAVLATK